MIYTEKAPVAPNSLFFFLFSPSLYITEVEVASQFTVQLVPTSR